MATFKTHLEYSLGLPGNKLAIMQVDENRTRTFVQPFELKAFPARVAVPDENLFCIRDQFDDGTVANFLQAMMDAAWEMGLRPKGMKDQRDELAAVRYHLEDMRRLALDVSPTIDAVQR